MGCMGYVKGKQHAPISCTWALRWRAHVQKRGAWGMGGRRGAGVTNFDWEWSAIEVRDKPFESAISIGIMDMMGETVQEDGSNAGDLPESTVGRRLLVTFTRAHSVPWNLSKMYLKWSFWNKWLRLGRHIKHSGTELEARLLSKIREIVRTTESHTFFGKCIIIMSIGQVEDLVWITKSSI